MRAPLDRRSRSGRRCGGRRRTSSAPRAAAPPAPARSSALARCAAPRVRRRSRRRPRPCRTTSRCPAGMLRPLDGLARARARAASDETMTPLRLISPRRVRSTHRSSSPKASCGPCGGRSCAEVQAPLVARVGVDEEVVPVAHHQAQAPVRVQLGRAPARRRSRSTSPIARHPASAIRSSRSQKTSSVSVEPTGSKRPLDDEAIAQGSRCAR